MDEKREGKTIFEHIGGFIGSDKNKDNDFFSKYKGIMKTFMFMVIAGVIIGIMLDTYMGTNTYTTIIPLLMALLFLIKWYKGSTKNKQKTKDNTNITLTFKKYLTIRDDIGNIDCDMCDRPCQKIGETWYECDFGTREMFTCKKCLERRNNEKSND